ncbi:MAG: hypothetical protein ACI91F_002603 [Candidatus Binatia bacterium]|jgi:hypothetical protein
MHQRPVMCPPRFRKASPALMLSGWRGTRADSRSMLLSLLRASLSLHEGAPLRP